MCRWLSLIFAPPELQSFLGYYFYKHCVPPGLKSCATKNKQDHSLRKL
jgi:hypothetical protein